MKLYITRHGHTEWNEAKKIQGSQNIELSEQGITQAYEFADQLLQSNHKISKVYSSELIRAAETAEIISTQLGIPLSLKKGLEEINLGLWEGLMWREVKESYPESFEIWFHSRRYQVPPQGESYQHLLERVIDSLLGITDTNREDVLVVTHSAVIMCLKCLIHETPFEAMGMYKVQNTELFVFEDSEIELAKSLL